jgi:hypothetical protein
VSDLLEHLDYHPTPERLARVREMSSGNHPCTSESLMGCHAKGDEQDRLKACVVDLKSIGYSYAEIGKELGYSKSRIRDIYLDATG